MSMDDSSDVSIMTPEEEEKWLGSYFSTAGAPALLADEAAASPKAAPASGTEPKAEAAPGTEPKAEPASGTEPKAEAASGTEPKAEPEQKDNTQQAAPEPEPEATEPAQKDGQQAATEPEPEATEPEQEAGEESIDSHMDSLEKEFEESMRLASSATGGLLSSSKASAAKECAVRKVYSELHAQADPEVIMKLRLAMEGIPKGTKGLLDCQTYFSSKQHYTLQDVLVAQYVLNDGLLMRQGHGTDDEYHVDITEPLM